MSINENKEHFFYILRHWYDMDKKSILLSILRVPCLVLIPTVIALIPKLMIEAIENRGPISQMLLQITILSVFLAFLQWANLFTDLKARAAMDCVQNKFSIMAFHKLLYMDYVNLESFEGRRKFERGRCFAAMDDEYRHSSIRLFAFVLMPLVSNILGIVFYIFLLLRLQPLLIAIIIASSFFEALLMWSKSRASEQYSDKSSSIFMRFEYFYRIAFEPRGGKDIRLYSLRDWFMATIARALMVHTKLLQKFIRQNTQISALQSLLAMAREIATYAFLISLAIKNDLSIADFIFYFGIATGFSGWMSGLSWQFVQLRTVCTECRKYREFLDMPDQLHVAENQTKQNNTVEKIEFRNVSFAYHPESDLVLKDINFTVTKGERIAVVGENGAGKTTLIKLLCGLYEPTQGEIFINSTNARQYNREERFRLCGAVFQDYHFLPMSVAANITLLPAGEENAVRLNEVLQQVGMLDKINALPNGPQTNMVKEVWQDATAFSGGEYQRLLLARALYKNAPILLLDEPTASLDPIAESEIYESYDQLSDVNKLSFFVSHRLASTQFCDRVFYLSQGKVEQEGSHEALMAQQGDYWRMFQAQSHYYRSKEANA